MTCCEFADLILDYLSRELPSTIQGHFELHLQLCQNCRRYLERYEETLVLGKRAFDDLDAAIPSEMPETLIRAILAARR